MACCKVRAPSEQAIVSGSDLKRMLHYVNVNCIAELVIVAIFVEMAETTIKFGVFDFFLYISTCVL